MKRDHLAHVEAEGFDAFAQNSEPLIANPYTRGTEEFGAWRGGWADAERLCWRGILMEKRKASTE